MSSCSDWAFFTMLYKKRKKNVLVCLPWFVYAIFVFQDGFTRDKEERYLQHSHRHGPPQHELFLQVVTVSYRTIDCTITMLQLMSLQTFYAMRDPISILCLKRWLNLDFENQCIRVVDSQVSENATNCNSIIIFFPQGHPPATDEQQQVPLSVHIFRRWNVSFVVLF